VAVRARATAPATGRRFLWLLLAPPVSALAVLTRGFPTTGSDAGIYLSVAGRLLNGDRLYRDVYDNKDPLFYFIQALAVRALGWRGIFLLDFGWVLIASTAASLLLWVVTKDFVLALLAQLLYPLLVTGIHYHSAYSETPPLSLLPVVAYLAYARRLRLAGVAAAAVLLLKIALLPTVVAVVAAGLLSAGGPWRRRGRDALTVASTLTALVVSCLAVLAARGELGGYWRTLRANKAYAAHALAVNGWPSGVSGHLYVAAALTPTTARVFIVVVLSLIAATAVLSADVRADSLRSPLAILTLLSSLGTLIVLGAVTLWDHHVQIIAFPLLCGAMLAFDCLRAASRALSGGAIRGVVIGVGLALVIGLAVSLQWPQASDARLWADRPLTQVSDALRATERSTPGARSFFHLGGNDDQGEAEFFGGSLRLACPRFHQYPFTPASELDSTMRCLRQRRPSLIAVTPKLATVRGPASARQLAPWNNFVRTAGAYLRAHCRLAKKNASVRVYVCN
jgi:hypothetical protein